MLHAILCFPPPDLKKTLAVLLDNIMVRLGKLESKVEIIYNSTGANLTNGTSTVTPSASNAEKVNVAGEAHSLLTLAYFFLLRIAESSFIEDIQKQAIAP